MDYPRRKHPRLKTYDYSTDGAYFITICTTDRRALLGEVLPGNDAALELGLSQVALSDLGKICCEAVENIQAVYPNVTVDSYVIMPNHVHMLLVLSGGGQGSGRPTVSRIVHGFKNVIARRVRKQLWQASFYEHIVRNEAEMTEIRRYILENPLKWELDYLHP